jgi:hypothetical protein
MHAGVVAGRAGCPAVSIFAGDWEGAAHPARRKEDVDHAPLPTRLEHLMHDEIRQALAIAS